MDEVIIVAYDTSWPDKFQQMASLIKETLDVALVYRIEHFGSTAVPGLAAKPIIDLLVGVYSLDLAKQLAVPLLMDLGYAYWADNPDPMRMFFVKGLPPYGPRTHHIHMVEADSPLWERLKFRDYLRQHPSEAQRYAALKSDLAAQFMHDREAYTRSKTDYIQSVMAKIAQGN